MLVHYMNDINANKLPHLVAEAKGLNAEFVGVQEVRRLDEGETSRDGYTLFYKGHTDKKMHGVGILINNLLVKNIERIYR